jgi:hypothetical protein
MLRRNKAGAFGPARPLRRFPAPRRRKMPDRKQDDQEQHKPIDEARPSEGGGNSLEDASDEAVRFMEESDEPGHAGRGDGG